jgi:DNA mismatch repair protein MutS2
MARSHLMEARQLVEQALGAARTAADDAAAREARRLVEEGIREQGERLADAERSDPSAETANAGAQAAQAGDRVRLETGQTGQVTEVRADGKLVVSVGAMRMVADPASVTRLGRHRASAPAPARVAEAPAVASSLEIDLRGMTGDEAEMATVAAVDAAVLAEQPFLRIIHGMGTGVVRERVRRVVAKDRRIARYGLAPRNQGGSGVTIVEFSA